MVSYWAILGLVLPLFMGIFTPQKAAAQSMSTMTVGVVEFSNDSGVQGGTLARLATDAVVIELSKSSRFDVVTRAQMDARMKELDIASPLNNTERSRLGEALQADAMIDGAVKAVQLRGEGATRRAAVTVVVRMIDQASGEVINGAVQTGHSNARVGAAVDDDRLISEAINNAAFQAVREIIDYIIPEATIQNTIRTDEVMLNKGARDGIRVGMRMIVTRDREIIGEIEVRQTDPNNSTASVVKYTRGIRPEDKARAVFDMPEVAYMKTDSGAKAPVSSAGKKTGGLAKIGKVLLGAAVIWGIVEIFNPNSTESVGAVTAEAGLSGYSLPVESGTPGVRVRWNARKLSRGLNVLQYHIWRNDVAGPVMTSLAAEGEAFDDANARGTVYSTADVEAHTLISGTTNVPAMNLGRPLKYYVSALYVVESAGGPLYYETDREDTGAATPIAQLLVAGLRLPMTGSQQNLHDVTFEWLSKRGADVYIVEASTDPTFRNPEYVSSPVTFASLEGQTVRLEVHESLYNLFRSVPSDQQIWWRVGARATGDDPGPIPPPGRSSMRYIYSEVNYFYPVEMPPSTP